MARNFPSQSRSSARRGRRVSAQRLFIVRSCGQNKRQERTSRSNRTPARMHFLRGERSHGNGHFDRNEHYRACGEFRAMADAKAHRHSTHRTSERRSRPPLPARRLGEISRNQRVGFFSYADNSRCGYLEHAIFLCDLEASAFLFVLIISCVSAYPFARPQLRTSPWNR